LGVGWAFGGLRLSENPRDPQITPKKTTMILKDNANVIRTIATGIGFTTSNIKKIRTKSYVFFSVSAAGFPNHEGAEP